MVIPIILNSSLDWERTERSFRSYAREFEGVHAKVYFASPELTPDRVQEIGELLGREKGIGPRAIITSARGQNTLAPALSPYLTPADLHLNIPLGGDTPYAFQEDLAGVLLPCQQWLKQRLLTVPFNAGYTALNIALRFEQQRYERVVFTGRKALGVAHLEHKAKLSGMPYLIKDKEEIHPNDLVVTCFHERDQQDLHELLQPIDEKLFPGEGVQIAMQVAGQREVDYLEDYFGHFTTNLKSTGFTRVDEVGLRVLTLPAQFLRRGETLRQIAEEQETIASRIRKQRTYSIGRSRA